jgi:hypothetical protein
MFAMAILFLCRSGYPYNLVQRKCDKPEAAEAGYAILSTSCPVSHDH